jgi:drug/metabolite transporter (DMT)-like permease
LIFTLFFALTSKHALIIKKENIKLQITLVLLVALMQYSTNYVFSKMNVAYALALFQLSTIVSIILGVNIFKEKELIKKLIASIIMIIGATILILN